MVQTRAMTRSRPGSLRQIASSGARIVKSGARVMIPLVAASRLRQQRQQHNTRPISFQHDVSNVYRRKRMPRRRRRRWVKFSRGVKHVVEKLAAPLFNIFVERQAITSGIGRQETCHLHTVLGGNGTAGFANDIQRLVTIAQANTNPQGPVAPVAKSLNIHITGWMVETQITNSSATSVAYVDLYYWKTKRDVPVALPDMDQLFINSLGDIQQNLPVAGTVTTLDRNDYGVTPFQGVQFAKSVQIYKKIRVKLSPGQTTQVEQRSGRDYYRRYSFDEHYSFLRNCTEGIYMIMYGATENIAGTPTVAATNISIYTNKNFTWRVSEDSRMKGMHDDV